MAIEAPNGDCTANIGGVMGTDGGSSSLSVADPANLTEEADRCGGTVLASDETPGASKLGAIAVSLDASSDMPCMLPYCKERPI